MPGVLGQVTAQSGGAERNLWDIGHAISIRKEADYWEIRACEREGGVCSHVQALQVLGRFPEEQGLLWEKRALNGQACISIPLSFFFL